MGNTTTGRRRFVWVGCIALGVWCLTPSALGWQGPPRGSSAVESVQGGLREAETAKKSAQDTSDTPPRERQADSFPTPATADRALRGVGDQDTPAAENGPPPHAPAPASARFKSLEEEAQDSGLEPVVLDVEAARFKDAQPGVTTRQQLESSWGAPIDVQRQDGLVRYVYEIEGFKQVTVVLREGKVSSIVIDMTENHPADDLARELGLAQQRWVMVRDEFGRALGQSLPERGVLLSFSPDSNARHVDQLIVEEIDAESFIQRAVTSIEDRCRESLADVDYALRLAPGDARAHWIRARILVRFGHWQGALAAAETAVQLAPEEPEYRLTHGSILGKLGFYKRAVADTQGAINHSSSRPEIMARGLVQLGDQIAAGPGRDYKSAIKHHLKAIRVAEPLKNDRRPVVRRAARRVLIDAHLAVAGDIAWGAWSRKVAVVPKWIERAEQITAETVARGDGGDELLLAVARGALAADVGLDGALDPTDYSAPLIEKGSRLIQQTSDPIARRHRQWELGMALHDALQIAHIREEPKQALQYGTMAAEYMENGSAIGRELPGYGYMMGRLYFRIGSIHAVHHGDHLRAVEWFDKAAPLMEQPIPVSSLADTGRQGETFVSMAVSYWNVGQNNEALRLTKLGLKLMEKAVEEGILSSLALTVPYHNLARIHRRLGDAEKAAEYERLAARHETTERR